jgi:D-3-phosphoglycerate dehydrogenase / 2-oxoglutarate reductase
LTAETRRMVRAETLELMQDGVIIINTSRGKVIDESALVAALESGQVSHAALDVFENEPLARESRLRKFTNVTLTPHIGAYTEEAFQKASQLAVQKFLDFNSTGALSDEL